MVLFLSELLHVYTLSCTLHSSSDTHMLKIQQYRCKTHGFHTFSWFGPHIWNSLPQYLGRCPTLLSFKVLKQELTNRLYNHPPALHPHNLLTKTHQQTLYLPPHSLRLSCRGQTWGRISLMTLCSFRFFSSVLLPLLPPPPLLHQLQRTTWMGHRLYRLLPQHLKNPQESHSVAHHRFQNAPEVKDRVVFHQRQLHYELAVRENYSATEAIW